MEPCTISRTKDRVSIERAGEPKDLAHFLTIFMEAVSRNAEALGIRTWLLRIIECDLNELDPTYDYTAKSGAGLTYIKHDLVWQYEASGPHDYPGRVEFVVETDNAQIGTEESRIMFAKLVAYEYSKAIKAVYPDYTTPYIDAPTVLKEALFSV